MPSPLRLTLVLASLALSSRAARAQRPANAASTCKRFVDIPGGSTPADSSYAPCALDQRPVLISEAGLPQPLRAHGIGGSFTVVVGADGVVDSARTRAWSIDGDMDDDAYEGTLRGLRGWRFRPAMRAGLAVRSGFRLEVESDRRNDTLPSRLRWSYHVGAAGADTLRGRWEVLAEAPRTLATADVDSVHAALLRRLVRMRVLRPDDGAPYCAVHVDPVDVAGRARFEELLRSALDPNRGDVYSRNVPVARGAGCERTPGSRRLFVPRIHATEGDRVVILPAGDYLSDWPPGARGTTHPAWSARCVGIAPRGGSASMDCDISPENTSASYRRRSERALPPKWYVAGDSVRLSLFATTHGAFQVDTLRATVHDVRRLADAAIVTGRSSCSYTWQVWTPRDTAVYVLVGDLSARGSLYLTNAIVGDAPRVPRRGCVPSTSPDSAYALFLLGDIGSAAPVTVCIGDPICTGRFELDPRRHTAAAHAAIRVRRADLREETRAGNELTFRVSVDPLPEGLIPIVMIRRRGNMMSEPWIMRRVSVNEWEFDVNFSPPLGPDSELAVYLVRR